jgi:hypothetical protein
MREDIAEHMISYLAETHNNDMQLYPDFAPVEQKYLKKRK